MDMREKAIAIIIAPGVPDAEVVPILDAVTEQAATFRVIAPDRANLSSLRLGSGRVLRADALAAGAQETWFDALIIVGGPEVGRFSQDKRAIELVTQFEIDAKPIAAIGTGLELLLAADLVAGMRVAAPGGLHPRIVSAGGHPTAETVVEDETWITAAEAEGVPELLERLFRSMSRLHHQARGMPNPQP